MSDDQQSYDVKDSRLLNLSVDDDRVTFTVYADGTLRRFCCEPFEQVYSRPGGGEVRAAENIPLHGLWAIAGGFPPERVMLWSDVHSGKTIAQADCGGPVLSVRLRSEFLVVVTERRALVFWCLDFGVRRVVETCANPEGLCAVSDPKRGITAMVFPAEEEGRVRVDLCTPEAVLIKSNAVAAHFSRLGCLALTEEGRFLATASVKGTIVRVFRTMDGVLLQELRRGVERAVIHSMAFSKTAIYSSDAETWLAISSDKGTVHVFSLNLRNPIPPNSLFSPSFIKGVIPKYFSTERSLAQFRLPEYSESLVAFGQLEHTIIVVDTNGSFYRCKFDPVKGGTMTQLEHRNFLNQEGPRFTIPAVFVQNRSVFRYPLGFGRRN